mgnify:CR=1 FL=1
MKTAPVPFAKLSYVAKCILTVLMVWLYGGLAGAQNDQYQIKVYDFEDGLSHRNVFKIQQDALGFIWIATINGLNRFDGYEFVQYHSRSPQHRIPFDAITDMLVDGDNRLWLANPDFLSIMNPADGSTHSVRLKTDEKVRREAMVPHSLFLDRDGAMWSAIYNEKSGGNTLLRTRPGGTAQAMLELDGAYARRPMARLGSMLYVGAFENELWKMHPDGRLSGKIELPFRGKDRSQSRIVQLQERNGILWILLANGHVFSLVDGNSSPVPHPVNKRLPRIAQAGALFVEPEGNLWVGGAGTLWYYDALSGQMVDYDDPIRQIVKNICTYRQIFKDRSGVVWVASDFGAVKIVQSNNLFSHYLSGGSEYCSNVYCSTRGITEDDQGRIYISYYNSIHVLDPRINSLRPLFPSNDYFNYPFGLLYHDGALWTGNGWRIDLRTLRVDTVFNIPHSDLGAVAIDNEGVMWFGCEYALFNYQPATQKLTKYSDYQGKWDSLDGRISYVYQGKTGGHVWVGTLNNGLWRIDPKKGRMKHLEEGRGQLRHKQVNAIYEDNQGNLWIGTADGLHKLHLADGKMKVYTTENGLPNNFINGMLPEGDSCLWVSTDNGLCRFHLKKENCSNFFAHDGLSANEFNRISFYKSRDGRMYFGGLNGVNAFYPSDRFTQRKKVQVESPLLLTNFSMFSGDSLLVRNYGIGNNHLLSLSHRDQMFAFSFAMADYRHPLQTQFSYMLEGYEKNWSLPSTINTVRYTNIPAGAYTFRVKARAGRDEWNSNELALRIVIHEAYYRTWWFRLICGLAGAGIIWGILRYRIYTIQKHEQELEQLVKARTAELEVEKHKSEELLLNILPVETAEELKQFGFAKAKRHEMVTVMFSDFKGFSRISEQLEPEELVDEIDFCFRTFDEIIDKHGLEKIKTVGDAYLCVGGIGEGHDNEAIQIIEAALEIQQFMAALAEEKKIQQKPYFEARIGIHTGPVVAGIVGIKKFAYDIWGDTVNIASRMETYGDVGKVNISEATYQLVKNHFHCAYHGQFTENSGAVNMYFVEEYAGK